MAVDFKERETLIPSSLLGDNQDDANPNESGSESVFSGFGSYGSSSSSYLNTSVGSELAEAESDDDDFIAQLTRQMADYMLQDDDDDENADLNCASQNSKETNYNLDYLQTSSVNTASVKKSNIGFQSIQSYTGDQIQPIQFYQLENQPQVRNSGGMSWGRKGKISSESGQQRKQHMVNKKGVANELGNGGIGIGIGNGKGFPLALGSSPVGSGMRAVFLGGSGSRNASCGTGVFLPRGTNNSPPDQGRKKPGCSTVLIPTRVLQALQQHFNNMDSLSSSNGFTSHLNQNVTAGVDNTQEKSQVRAAMDHQETELPQEWIY